MNSQIYLFLLVALCTGMRREEIASIELAHIDLERRVLSIPEAKAGRRLAPISKHLLAALQKEKMKAKVDQRFLFPSTSSASGYTTNPQKAFKRCLERAGLPSSFRIHDLRHTAVTHLMQAGVDIGTIQAISGHKTVQMVMRYSHTARDLMNKAVDDLADRLVGDF
jgi:integrase